MLPLVMLIHHLRYDLIDSNLAPNSLCSVDNCEFLNLPPSPPESCEYGCVSPSSVAVVLATEPGHTHRTNALSTESYLCLCWWFFYKHFQHPNFHLDLKSEFNVDSEHILFMIVKVETDSARGHVPLDAREDRCLFLARVAEIQHLQKTNLIFQNSPIGLEDVSFKSQRLQLFEPPFWDVYIYLQNFIWCMSSQLYNKDLRALWYYLPWIIAWGAYWITLYNFYRLDLISGLTVIL